MRTSTSSNSTAVDNRKQYACCRLTRCSKRASRGVLPCEAQGRFMGLHSVAERGPWDGKQLAWPLVELWECFLFWPIRGRLGRLYSDVFVFSQLF